MKTLTHEYVQSAALRPGQQLVITVSPLREPYSDLDGLQERLDSGGFKDLHPAGGGPSGAAGATQQRSPEPAKIQVTVPARPLTAMGMTTEYHAGHQEQLQNIEQEKAELVKFERELRDTLARADFIRADILVARERVYHVVTAK